MGSELAGRCIWVTAADTKIGQALAVALSEMGNFVIVTGANDAVLQRLVFAASGRICALPLDLAVDGERLLDCSAKLAEVTDYIDVVICCAPEAEFDEHGQTAPQIYRRAMDSHYLPVVSALHLSLPYLKRALYTPQFVAFGGIFGTTEGTCRSAHAAAEAALACFLRNLPAQTQPLCLKSTFIRCCRLHINGSRVAGCMPSSGQEFDADVKLIIAGIKDQSQVISIPEPHSWRRRFLGLMTRCRSKWAT